MFTPATLFQVAACGTKFSERIDALPVYERHRFIPGAVNRCSKLPCRELIQVIHHLFHGDVLSAKRTNTNRVPGGSHFSPPFVGELWTGPFGLSSKKRKFPRTEIPGNNPSTYNYLLYYLRRTCSMTRTIANTAIAVMATAATIPMGDQDTTSRHTPSIHSYGSLIIIPFQGMS